MASMLTFTAILIVTVLPTSTAEPACACDDFPPPGTNCLEQKAMGNCFAPGIVHGGYCKLTCDRCDLCWETENEFVPRDCDCPDVPPPGGFTCAQQAEWGKCSEGWLVDGGYCQGTCCTCPAVPADPKCDCADIQPPGEYSCAQQAAWGKCSDSWMVSGGYCQGICCSCPIETKPNPECDCGDKQPPGGFSCAEQVSWGKCDEAWMMSGGYCLGSCCKCPQEAECDCEDFQPPGDYTCAQQAAWGKCSEDWMVDGGYCAKTCDRCECNTPTTEELIEFDELDFIANQGSDDALQEDFSGGSTPVSSSEARKIEILDALLPSFDKSEVVESANIVPSFVDEYNYQKEVEYKKTPIYIS